MRLGSQFVVLSLFAAGVAAGWLWWPADGQETNAEKNGGGATLVLTEPVDLAEDTTVLRAIGTGEARRSATIHAATTGEVIEVGFEPEQRVRKGKVLLRLDSKHQRLAVRLAEVQVKEMTRQLSRLERLAPSGAASQARLQTAQAALESASLRLDQAKIDLRDRTVYAPFDGVIGLTDVDVGDRITEDTPITTLDDRRHINVTFKLPEDYATRVEIGTLVTVHPWSAPKRRIDGFISATASRIDPQTRSLEVEAEIANDDDSLRPGTSFGVEMVFVGAAYPAIREVAVLWSRDGAYLWRIENGRARKVFVKIVRRTAGRILVDGPLAPGDLIVVEGVQGLRPNQAVTARPFDPAVAPAKAGS